MKSSSYPSPFMDNPLLIWLNSSTLPFLPETLELPPASIIFQNSEPHPLPHFHPPTQIRGVHTGSSKVGFKNRKKLNNPGTADRIKFK